MRRTIAIFILFVLAASQAFSQDHYSGNTRVEGTSAEYNVSRKTFGHRMFIDLVNTVNELSDKLPYDTVSQCYYSEALHPQPLAQPDYEMLDKIVDSVFCASDKEKYFSQDCHLFIDFSVDPRTCHAIEIVFGLHYTSDDKRILALPVSKIEQLEAVLKKDLIFYVPKRGIDADFLFISGRVL